MSRSSRTETLRVLTSTLSTNKSNQEAAWVLQTTKSMLQCFLFFDICFFISSIGLITMALTNQLDNRDKIILFGGLFSIYASVSAFCNSLATYGVRTWRRNFIIPWLVFFLMVLVLLIMYMVHSLYIERAQWRHVFLFYAIICIFSCWRHMQKQFILMALPKLQTTDVESVVKEFLSPVTTFSSLKELPPKYEDVEDFPPEYDEQTMITQEKQSNYVCEGSTTVQNVQ